MQTKTPIVQHLAPKNIPKSNPNATMHSTAVERCQICGAPDLRSLLFLGYVPALNSTYPVSARPREQNVFPAEALFCPKCHLTQLGCYAHHPLAQASLGAVLVLWVWTHVAV